MSGLFITVCTASLPIFPLAPAIATRIVICLHPFLSNGLCPCLQTSPSPGHGHVPNQYPLNSPYKSRRTGHLPSLLQCCFQLPNFSFSSDRTGASLLWKVPQVLLSYGPSFPSAENSLLCTVLCIGPRPAAVVSSFCLRSYHHTPQSIVKKTNDVVKIH